MVLTPRTDGAGSLIPMRAHGIALVRATLPRPPRATPPEPPSFAAQIALHASMFDGSDAIASQTTVRSCRPSEAPPSGHAASSADKNVTNGPPGRTGKHPARPLAADDPPCGVPGVVRHMDEMIERYAGPHRSQTTGAAQDQPATGCPGKDMVSRRMIRGIHHFGLTVRDVACERSLVRGSARLPARRRFQGVGRGTPQGIPPARRPASSAGAQGARYRRLARRRGKPKAQVAVATPSSRSTTSCCPTPACATRTSARTTTNASPTSAAGSPATSASSAPSASKSPSAASPTPTQTEPGPAQAA